ncbi:MAG TPA: hypothetical protein VMR81_05595 [Patescibacteria group bacterium]|nr:hypothetical protein [Patescibacteria group bacterium]
MTSPDRIDGNTRHKIPVTRVPDGNFRDYVHAQLHFEKPSVLRSEVDQAQDPENQFSSDPPEVEIAPDFSDTPDDEALMRDAQIAQNTANQFTPRPFAELLTGPDFASRGKIIGKIIFPVPSKDNSSLVSHVDRLGHKLLTRRVQRFAIIFSQEGPELQGVFRFIPIHELPKTQDPGSLKTLSYRKIKEALEKAGGNAESISEALQQIPDSSMWSNASIWMDHGGHPHRRGATKRNPSSYHFGATPREIDRRNKR